MGPIHPALSFKLCVARNHVARGQFIGDDFGFRVPLCWSFHVLEG